MEDETTPGLKGVDFAVAMFAAMFLVTGAALDLLASLWLGLASLAVAGLGLWGLYRWLKRGRPQPMRFVVAVVIVAVALGARVVLHKVLPTGF